MDPTQYIAATSAKFTNLKNTIPTLQQRFDDASNSLPSLTNQVSSAKVKKQTLEVEMKEQTNAQTVLTQEDQLLNEVLSLQIEPADMLGQHPEHHE